MTNMTDLKTHAPEVQPSAGNGAQLSVNPQQRHVRMLLDLALYLRDCQQIGQDADSRCTRVILLPVRISISSLRHLAVELAGTSGTAVYNLAIALASLPQLAALFSPSRIDDALREACSPYENQPALDRNDSDGIIERRFVQLVRYLEKRLIDGSGAHTRAFEYFVPDSCVIVGRGTAGGEYREHAVPCALLREHCQRLLTEGIAVEAVARWLRPYLVIVLIQKEQADEIDRRPGLKTGMPTDWRFDSGCAFERLHSAGIAFHLTATGAGCMH